jgi:pyruvate decarboxylase
MEACLILSILLFTYLTGVGLARNRLEKEAVALIETTGYHYFVTAMGKGSVSEHLPTFGGIYGGSSSFDEIKKTVESSDCVLWLGNYPV